MRSRGRTRRAPTRRRPSAASVRISHHKPVSARPLHDSKRIERVNDELRVRVDILIDSRHCNHTTSGAQSGLRSGNRSLEHWATLPRYTESSSCHQVRFRAGPCVTCVLKRDHDLRRAQARRVHPSHRDRPLSRGEYRTSGPGKPLKRLCGAWNGINAGDVLEL